MGNRRSRSDPAADVVNEHAGFPETESVVKALRVVGRRGRSRLRVATRRRLICKQSQEPIDDGSALFV